MQLVVLFCCQAMLPHFAHRCEEGAQVLEDAKVPGRHHSHHTRTRIFVDRSAATCFSAYHSDNTRLSAVGMAAFAPPPRTPWRRTFFSFMRGRLKRSYAFPAPLLVCLRCCQGADIVISDSCLCSAQAVPEAWAQLLQSELRLFLCPRRTYLGLR